MKIIILAAGMGSRLGNPFPKPLTPLVDGRSIMQQQLENLTTYFEQDDIQLVVGFKKELIMETFPDMSFIYNPYFDQTNTSKSLLKALKKNRFESVLWLNGDVVFDKEIIADLLPLIAQDVSFVCVNNQECGEEEVKYTLDPNGFVNQISKQVQGGLGEAVGINYIARKDMAVFINRLEACDNNDYFEKGLEMAIQEDGLKLKAFDVSAHRCLEVDFGEDLEKANRLFRKR
jgi:L-glutamine-phosphate cytidylyltransferase